MRCGADCTCGTTVEVTSDLTATDPRGRDRLEDFARGYADLLEGWRVRTRGLLA